MSNCHIVCIDRPVQLFLFSLSPISAIEIFKGIKGDGNIQGDFNQTLNKLITVSDKSTYLSIGMYGICQLAVANKLNPQQTKELTKILLEKATAK